MGRIRTIKPEFFTDEELSGLDAQMHLFAAGLLCYADDYGYFNAHPKLTKAAIFPLREDCENIPEFFRRLQEIGFISLGTTSDGKHWGHIVKFYSHQRVSHPTPSKISSLQITWDGKEAPPENIGRPPENIRQEGKGKEVGRDIAGDIPEWISEVSWLSFIEMRKKIKKPLTDHAKTLALKKLEKFKADGYDPQEILDAAVMNDWQGFYIPKGQDGQLIKPTKRKFTALDPTPENWARCIIPDAEGIL